MPHRRIRIYMSIHTRYIFFMNMIFVVAAAYRYKIMMTIDKTKFYRCPLLVHVHQLCWSDTMSCLRFEVDNRSTKNLCLSTWCVTSATWLQVEYNWQLGRSIWCIYGTTTIITVDHLCTTTTLHFIFSMSHIRSENWQQTIYEVDLTGVSCMSNGNFIGTFECWNIVVFLLLIIVFVR
jgi:hypothetical protein